MRPAPPEKEMECRNSGWKPPFSAPMLESTTGLAAPVLHILGLKIEAGPRSGAKTVVEARRLPDGDCGSLILSSGFDVEGTERTL